MKNFPLCFQLQSINNAFPHPSQLYHCPCFKRKRPCFFSVSLRVLLVSLFQISVQIFSFHLLLLIFLLNFFASLIISSSYSPPARPLPSSLSFTLFSFCSAAMATASLTPKEKKNTSFPPRRGLIKRQIFAKLVKVVVNKASKPGARGKNRAEDGGESSASQTPPPSAYNSDANSDF